MRLAISALASCWLGCRRQGSSPRQGALPWMGSGGFVGLGSSGADSSDGGGFAMGSEGDGGLARGENGDGGRGVADVGVIVEDGARKDDLPLAIEGHVGIF